MSLTQLSDNLILPVLAGKTPDQQRAILLALRKESGLRAQVWIDRQLAALEGQCSECGERDAMVTGYDPHQASCRFCGSLHVSELGQ